MDVCKRLSAWISLAVIMLALGGCVPVPQPYDGTALKEGEYLVAFQVHEWNVLVEDDGKSKRLKTVVPSHECRMMFDALGPLCGPQNGALQVVRVHAGELVIASGMINHDEVAISFEPIRFRLKPGKINYIGDIAIDWIRADRRYPDQTSHHHAFRFWFVDHFAWAREDLGAGSLEVVNRFADAPVYDYLPEAPNDWLGTMLGLAFRVTHKGFPLPKGKP